MNKIAIRNYVIAVFLIGALTVLYASSEHGRISMAQLLYRVGNSLFDHASPGWYQTQTALAFFERALVLDTQHRYVRHQIARIHFLHGDFNRALRVINTQIVLYGDAVPNSYYVRGLIYGFMGEYEKAADDYRTYLKSDPTNWAATNDLAWVLLKDERYDETLTAIDAVLHLWPENPWLHNSRATALFELGRFEEALASAQKASRAAESITEKAWQQAYPGNDPLIAKEGVAALQGAIRDNIHTIEVARASEGVDVP